MNSILERAVALFKKGLRNEAYCFLSKVISDESMSCSVDEELSRTVIDEVIFQCSQETTRSSLEILSWIFSNDFIGRNGSLLGIVSTLESVDHAISMICHAIDSSDEQTICVALFAISEQCILFLFEKHSRRIGSLLFGCLDQLRPRNIRLYAYRAMIKMFPSIKKNYTDKDICEMAMNINMIDDWKSNDQKLREASLDLAEVCTNEGALISLLPNAEKETKDLMKYMWY